MRNITLDYFKLCLSFLVVSIHLNPLFIGEYRLFGDAISEGIALIAVPSFFTINGFFLYDKISDFNKIKKLVSRFLIVYIVWSLIYLPFWVSVGYGKFITTVFIILGYGHLWYLSGLIISILILYTLFRFHVHFKILIPLFLFLYFFGIYLEFSFGSEATPLSGRLLLINLVRSIFTTGVPFVFLGYYLKCAFCKKMTLISGRLLFIVSLICVLLILLEVYLSYVGWSVTTPYILFILSSFSRITLCISLFILVNKYPTISKPGDSRFIGELSSGIYYSHVLCIFIANILVDSMNIYKFPLVIFLSMLVSTVLITLNSRLKIFL